MARKHEEEKAQGAPSSNIAEILDAMPQGKAMSNIAATEEKRASADDEDDEDDEDEGEDDDEVDDDEESTPSENSHSTNGNVDPQNESNVPVIPPTQETFDRPIIKETFDRLDALVAVDKTAGPNDQKTKSAVKAVEEMKKPGQNREARDEFFKKFKKLDR
ncbi:hypothetical protein ACHAPD_001701 [Fusarium lateritium]